jgi:hypothetical protein
MESLSKVYFPLNNRISFSLLERLQFSNIVLTEIDEAPPEDQATTDYKRNLMGTIQLHLQKMIVHEEDPFSDVGGDGIAREYGAPRVYEQDEVIAGKISVGTRSTFISNNSSFGEPILQDHVLDLEADAHPDTSQNHTLTIKYKTRAFLQGIGRIPV